MNHRQNLDKLAEALEGLPVLGCLEGSPARQAGLRYGDIILRANGLRTRNLRDYLAARAGEGETLALGVFRDGAELTVDLPLRRTQVTPQDAVRQLASLVAARILGGDGEEGGEVS